MTTVTTRDAREIAADVATTFDAVFAEIDRWCAVVRDHLVEHADRTAASVDPVVESFAVPAVSGPSLLTGAGFVAAPDVLDDARWHLAWWLAGRGPGASPRRLATIEDPLHEQFRDYTALEWWRVPVATGTRHLTGPYVDYVCTDDYTVTITTPVVVGDRVIGVVGADALVDRLERELLPLLRTGPGPSTIVNTSGRVVTSTDARREPGSLLRGVQSEGTGPGAAVPCGDTTLSLVVGV